MNSKNTFNKKAISPLIATILLVVVAVAIIAIILSWGKGFAIDSISKTKTIKIYTESENGFFLNVKDSINGRTYVEYSPPPNSPITSLTFTGYSLLGYENKVPLDPPVTIKKGETAYIDHGIILNSFGLVLYQDNQRMITKKNIKQRIIQPFSCPQGYIPVPGNYLYGTMNEKGGFCVAKYEMKASKTGVNNGKGLINDNNAYYVPVYPTYNIWEYNKDSNINIVSTPEGSPITYISQIQAIAECKKEPGRHLITNNEWMTIVRNIEQVPSNWSNGVVGSGNIPRGNSNSSAAKDALSDLTGINKRTLTLTNGEVIWDLAGNVWDWTDNSVLQKDEPDGFLKSDDSNSFVSDWHDYSKGSLAQYITSTNLGNTTFKYKDLFLLTSNKYNADNTNGGIGRIWIDSNINSNLTGSRVFARGGYWGNDTNAGVLALFLNYGSSTTYFYRGFRCSQ